MIPLNYIQYITERGLIRNIFTVFCLLCLLLCSSTAMAIATADEEILDREAGILDRPWRINLVRLASRDYLRYKAQVKTGLPSYDQLVEGARRAPQILLNRVTASPGVPFQTTPLSVTSTTVAAPASLTATAPVTSARSEIIPPVLLPPTTLEIVPPALLPLVLPPSIPPPGASIIP